MKRSKTPGFSLALARREREGRARQMAEDTQAVQSNFELLRVRGALVLNERVEYSDDEDHEDHERRQAARRRLIRGMKDACRAAGRQFRFTTDSRGFVTFAVTRR